MRALSSAVVVFAGVLALTSVCPTARADENISENEQKAFALGLERFRAGDTRSAIDIWSRLLETIGAERGWRVTYNLGRAYEKVGDPTRAMEHFTAFLAVAEHQRGAVATESAGAVKDARQRVAAIEKSHGVLEVDAPATGIVMVRVGLGEARNAGFKLYLKPGKHVLTFRPGSPLEKSETLEIRAGEKLTRVPEPDAAEAPPPQATERPKEPLPPPPAKGSKPETKSFPTLWVGIGTAATVVASGVSFVLYRRAKDRRDDAADLGTKNPGYSDAKHDYESAYRTYQLSLIAPALLGAATVTLVVLHLGGSNERQVTLRISPTHTSLSGSF